jgi:hypothetical protein
MGDDNEEEDITNSSLLANISLKPLFFHPSDQYKSFSGKLTIGHKHILKSVLDSSGKCELIRLVNLSEVERTLLRLLIVFGLLIIPSFVCLFSSVLDF